LKSRRKKAKRKINVSIFFVTLHLKSRRKITVLINLYRLSFRLKGEICFVNGISPVGRNDKIDTKFPIPKLHYKKNGIITDKNFMNNFYKIFLLFVFCSFFLTLAAQDEPTPEKQVKNLYTKPVVRGFSLHADIASPFMGLIIDKSVKTFEIQADINLFDKIFPIIEGGFGSVNATLENGNSYKTAAPFFRVGLNYNLIKNVTKEGVPKIIRSYPFVGVRYGFGIVPYKIDNVKVTSDYWGETQTMNFSNLGVFAGWLEVVGGVRVDIKSGFTMGWNVRLKTFFHSSKDKPQLWYVPGYGLTSGSVFGFNYTIGYTFKIKEKKKDKK